MQQGTKERKKMSANQLMHPVERTRGPPRAKHKKKKRKKKRFYSLALRTQWCMDDVWRTSAIVTEPHVQPQTFPIHSSSWKKVSVFLLMKKEGRRTYNHRFALSPCPTSSRFSSLLVRLVTQIILLFTITDTLFFFSHCLSHFRSFSRSLFSTLSLTFFPAYAIGAHHRTRVAHLSSSCPVKSEGACKIYF